MSQTILLVDDSAFIRTIVKVHLVDRKFTFLDAGEGQEALDLLQANRVDLIIADIGMPGMDGLTFIRRVRALGDPERRDVPIILLTAASPEALASEALEAGANAYLQKPVSTAGLVETVHRLLPPAAG